MNNTGNELKKMPRYPLGNWSLSEKYFIFKKTFTPPTINPINEKPMAKTINDGRYVQTAAPMPIKMDK